MDNERLEKLKGITEQLYKDGNVPLTYCDDVIDLIDETTTSCEWCEIARACEYNVTFFEDDNRWATERSLLPRYCPNCGRRLED